MFDYKIIQFIEEDKLKGFNVLLRSGLMFKAKRVGIYIVPEMSYKIFDLLDEEKIHYITWQTWQTN